MATDFDRDAVLTLRRNFPHLSVYHGSIEDLSSSFILRNTGLDVGALDVLDGSPPCQGFSVSGKRIFDDDRNKLFREFVRLLDELKPKVFVMENVPGLVAGKMKLLFVEILKELKLVGYRVRARSMNSKFYNVPQSRKRIIFIGIRSEFDFEPSYPPPSSPPIAASEAIKDLADINDEEKRMLIEAGRRYPLYRWWHLMTPGQSVDDVKKGQGFNCVKYHPDRPASTVTKSDARISAFGSLHWAEKRRFTLAEYKRFASFPDQYLFTDWKNGVERIGNSVPPLLMTAIARHIRAEILPHCLVTP